MAKGHEEKNDIGVLVIMVTNHHKVMVKQSESGIHFLSNDSWSMVTSANMPSTGTLGYNPNMIHTMLFIWSSVIHIVYQQPK
jgi:hypothetical protein